MRTLYRASRVVTLSYPPAGEWVLVDERHVQRVGAGEPPEAERVVDLPGTTIVPGFVDSHVHLTGTGIHLGTPEVADARSAEELLAAARRAVADRTGPTLVHGYDESKWAIRRPPGLADLDALSDRPLAIVRVDGHLTLANTAALRESGVLEVGGAERDRSGAPTGVVTREANDQVQRWFHQHLSDHDIEQLQLRAAGLAASRGVTCVHEMSMPKDRGLRDLQILLEHRSRLPIDVVTYVATTDIPQVIDLQLPRIGGDLPVDGSIGARTARLSVPYADGEGSGVAYHADDELAEFLHDAHLAGLQVGVHAIGDLAIEQVVATWERVYHALDSRGRRHFRARRHRIEHFEMPGPEQMERAAVLGLAISVQPSFDAEWGHPGGLYDVRLGWDRAAAMNPFRSFLERGIEVGAGSDSPITPLDPMAGIAAFERHHDPAQRLSREEAVRLYTQGSARLAHLEEKKGALEPGMHADLAAYEADPFAAPDVEGLRPVLTVSLGREVYAA
ncbi:MAG: amidohydrolase family protein [Actinobacteria bacterium]|nr:amidohydrolase family protein [Actinomycetota bacterium]